jgi:hypothetical protein
MGRKQKVGESFERTFCKHTILNKISGKFAGAASRLGLDRVVFIDACAANGIPSQFSRTSSPEIFCKHLKFLHDCRCPALAYLIEIDRAIFDRLKTSITAIAAKLAFPQLRENLMLVHGDYRTPSVVDLLGPFTDDTALFMFVDPNTPPQIELVAALRSKLPPLTTWMVSLGVNAGGIKRLPQTERLEWFGRVKDLVDCVQWYQDAALIRLENDSSQWAYLLNVPEKWRQQTEADIQALQKYWPRGISHFWLSDRKLLPAAKELFLTRSEVARITQPELFDL